MRKFLNKSHNIVVMLGKIPRYRHYYLKQLSVKELNPYILGKLRKFSTNEVDQIERIQGSFLENLFMIYQTFPNKF